MAAPARPQACTHLPHLRSPALGHSGYTPSQPPCLAFTRCRAESPLHVAAAARTLLSAHVLGAPGRPSPRSKSCRLYADCPCLGERVVDADGKAGPFKFMTFREAEEASAPKEKESAADRTAAC